MFDIDKIITAIQTDPNARKIAGAGAGGVVMGLLLGGGGVKSVVKYGALAAIGGLAYNAWQKNRKSEGFSPVETPPPGPFMPAPDDEAGQEALGRALVRAMIAAAKADGRIDFEEKERIFNRLDGMDLSSEEKAFVFDELSSPLDIDAVARGADTPEHAAEIYAASLVAITVDTPAERNYLEALADRLGLPQSLVSEIHAAAGK